MDITKKKSRKDLQAYFRKNNIPTEKNFADLIGAALNQRDDGVYKPETDALCVQAADQSHRPVLSLYHDFADPDASWIVSLGTKDGAKDGFAISNGSVDRDAGVERLFIDGATGNVGIATTAPTSTLHVAGTVEAQGAVVARSTLEVQGAATLGATLDVAGAVTAAEATLAGALAAATATVTGQLSAGALSAGSAAVTGKLTAGSAAVTGKLTAGSFAAGTTELSGALTATSIAATSATFSGALSSNSISAASATLTGELSSNSISATSATFSGALSSNSISAASATLTGELSSNSISAASAALSGALSSNSISAASVTLTGELSSNSISAASATVSGALSARSLLVNGQSVTRVATAIGSEADAGTAVPTQKAVVDHVASAIGATARGAVPIGTIVMWSNYNNLPIPAGWRLCDGGEDNGVKRPDLRDRFILASGEYAIGATGGHKRVTLQATEMPAHQHTVTVSGGGHRHTFNAYYQGLKREGSATESTLFPKDKNNAALSAIPVENRTTNDREGDHSHTVTVTDAGGGQAHENMPPYYVLAFIIRVS